jgi:hypothetical protein
MELDFLSAIFTDVLLGEHYDDQLSNIIAYGKTADRASLGKKPS